MSAKASKKTKKDLAAKIAELEAKLSQLSKVSAKPSTQAPPPPPKQQAPPQPKPSVQIPPPPAAKPVWEQWKDVPMGNWNIQKTKVPGYVSAPNRYYASRVVLRADVPTSNWNLQKPKVPGYTQPSNKYFATRARLAYHPPAKQFAGYGIVGAAQVQTYSAPPSPPPPQQMSSHSQQSGTQKSRKQTLEEYERNYLSRVEQDRQEAKKASQTAAAAKTSQASTRGTMPQGWKP
jgi:hypothetical protein